MGVSDAFRPVVCKTCGNMALFHHETKGICRRCGPSAQFGVCSMPYAFKHLNQLLGAAGLNIALTFRNVGDGTEGTEGTEGVEE